MYAIRSYYDNGHRFYSDYFDAQQEKTSSKITNKIVFPTMNKLKIYISILCFLPAMTMVAQENPTDSLTIGSIMQEMIEHYPVLKNVITSYSIHYTKLYETHIVQKNKKVI